MEEKGGKYVAKTREGSKDIFFRKIEVNYCSSS
jgi:hypothetical protein